MGIMGGSGKVMIADRVSFKSEFGYLLASEDGTRSVEVLTAAEKFLIGLPGQEAGLKMANGLHYGEVVTFENLNTYMQCDHNGWITIRAKPTSNWDHFTLLSSTHSEGIISYDDKIVLRAHNGRMVSVRLDNNALEAVSLAITDRSEFTIIGAAGTASGVVHDRDRVALRTFQGYVANDNGGARVSWGSPVTTHRIRSSSSTRSGTALCKCRHFMAGVVHIPLKYADCDVQVKY